MAPVWNQQVVGLVAERMVEHMAERMAELVGSILFRDIRVAVYGAKIINRCHNHAWNKMGTLCSPPSSIITLLIYGILFQNVACPNKTKAEYFSRRTTWDQPGVWRPLYGECWEIEHRM